MYGSVSAYTAALSNGEPGANNAAVTYVGTNDLHLVCAEWNNSALTAAQIAGIPYDIDRDFRPLVTFRGADEAPGLNIAALPGCTASTGSVSISTGPGSFSYTWLPTGGSGSVAAGLSPGDYTVSVSDGAGCSATRTLNLVQGPPTFSVSFATHRNASCNGIADGSVSIAVAGEAGPFTYTWLPSGGNASSANSLAPGIYSVTVSNSVSCARTVTFGITQPPAITVAIGSSVPGAVCAGNSAILTSTASGGTGTISYSWAGGPLNNTYTVQPGAATVYTAAAQDLYGCVATATVSLAVKPLPVVTVNSGVICAGGTFVMSPAGAMNYIFSSGNAVVSPAAYTTYTVTGIGQNGCSAIAVSSVAVNPLPLITVSGTTLCAGSSFTIVPAGGTSYTYSGGSDVVNPQFTTSYTVYGSDQNNCRNSAVAEITVVPVPIIIVNSGTICSADQFSITPAGALSYTFSGGSNVVNPVQTSTYLVTGQGPDGCLGTATSSVSVIALPGVTLSPASVTLCRDDAARKLNGFPAGGIYSGAHVAGGIFTPSVAGTFTLAYKFTDPGTACSNIAGSTFIVSECTGISSTLLHTIDLYPNPGIGEFRIVSQGGPIREVRVLDLSGRQVYAVTANDHYIGVDLREVAAGVYYFHIRSELGLSVVKVVRL